MSIASPKVKVPTKVTRLPKVTREDTIEENPDLAWTRIDSVINGWNSSQAQTFTEFNYEGRVE